MSGRAQVPGRASGHTACSPSCIASQITARSPRESCVGLRVKLQRSSAALPRPILLLSPAPDQPQCIDEHFDEEQAAIAVMDKYNAPIVNSDARSCISAAPRTSGSAHFSPTPKLMRSVSYRPSSLIIATSSNSSNTTTCPAMPETLVSHPGLYRNHPIRSMTPIAPSL